MTDASLNETPVIPAALHGRRRPRPLGRTDRSPLALWYSEIDRPLLAMVLGLMAIGLLAVAVASPVGALEMARQTNRPVDNFYYLYRQIVLVCAAIGVMIYVGMRPKITIRRWSMIWLAVGIVALVLVLVVGSGSKGSMRWLGSGMFRVQPSEFLKPIFAIAVGWILSCRVEDPKLPVFSLTFALTLLIAILLMLETDFGQTVLYVGTWVVLAFVAGLSFRLMMAMGFGALLFAIGTYFTYPTARFRIDAFLFGEGDQHQVNRGFETLTASGLVGSGPFTGTAKFGLPEAHTDYIFSVIGEEFGLIACAGILLLFIALIVRVVQRLREERDQFVILAGAGLICQFAAQVFINIGMNLQIMPTKGMTLPFISAGGSSLIAQAIGMGLLLALTRRNPYRARPANVATWNPR